MSALKLYLDSRIAIISLYYQVRGNYSHYTKVIAPPNMLRARELLKSIPDDEDDDTRISVPRRKGKQRLREELRENLARHNKTRPERSSYRPTRKRRRG